MEGGEGEEQSEELSVGKYFYQIDSLTQILSQIVTRTVTHTLTQNVSPESI